MGTLFVDLDQRDDPWISIEGEQPVPDGVDVIVSLDIFQSQREELLARNDGRIGVYLEPLEPVSAIAGDLDRLSVVALNFPSFADGTSFSKARQLRDAHGFEGEVRGVGDVRIDQIGHMQRCGFNAFVVENDATIAALSKGDNPALHLHYQPAADETKTGPGAKRWARRALD